MLAACINSCVWWGGVRGGGVLKLHVSHPQMAVIQHGITMTYVGSFEARPNYIQHCVPSFRNAGVPVQLVVISCDFNDN